MKKVVPFTPMILGEESKNVKVEILQYNGETIEVPYSFDMFVHNNKRNRVIENGDVYVMYRSIEEHWDDYGRSTYSNYKTLQSIDNTTQINPEGKPLILENSIFIYEEYIKNRFANKRGRKSKVEVAIRGEVDFLKNFEVIEVVEVNSEKTPEYYG